MALMTRADFARWAGVHKSTVTRWGADGRLVEEGGLVDSEASLRRIEATHGTRPDVADRHAAGRGAAVRAPDQATSGAAQPAQPAPADRPAPRPEPTLQPGVLLTAEDIGIRTRLAQMHKAEAEAAIKDRENRLASGEVVPRAAVRADVETACGTLLNAFEGVADRLTPLLLGLTDADRVRAMIRDEISATLNQAADALGKVAG